MRIQTCRFSMKQKINELFNGNIDDKTPNHANSLCRIAYSGLLANQGVKTKEIAKEMNCCRQLVNHRKRKHLDFYDFDKNYRIKIDLLFAN